MIENHIKIVEVAIKRINNDNKCNNNKNDLTKSSVTKDPNSTQVFNMTTQLSTQLSTQIAPSTSTQICTQTQNIQKQSITEQQKKLTVLNNFLHKCSMGGFEGWF